MGWYLNPFLECIKKGEVKTLYLYILLEKTQFQIKRWTCETVKRGNKGKIVWLKCHLNDHTKFGLVPPIF